MEHRATSGFWQHYHALPPRIRSSANKQFSLLKANPQHGHCNLRKSATGKAKKFDERLGRKSVERGRCSKKMNAHSLKPMQALEGIDDQQLNFDGSYLDLGIGDLLVKVYKF